MTDALEQQGMEALVQRHLGTAGTDVDLRAQLVLYEVGWAIRAGEEGKEGAEGEGREEAPLSRASPHRLEPQPLPSGPNSARTPCGWRMETSKKPSQVGGAPPAENLPQRRARGAADL